MAVIETWFNQDLQKPVTVQYLDGSLFSNNGNGNRIGVNVYDNGEAVTLTGSVSGYAVLSDGTTVPCTGARTGNQASILVPPAAYVPGALFLSVFLTDGTTVTTLAAVSTSVLLARTDSQVDPGSVVTDWTQTINGAMQDVQTAAENLGQIVATPYASLTYPVPLGKYTYYNGNLYRCVSPIASIESFTPAHWSAAINLGDEVSNLKSAIEGTPLNIVFPANTYYNTSDSKFHTNSKRLSNGTPQIIKNLYISCDSSEKYDIFQFNKVASTGTMNTDYEYISHTGWKTESGEYSFSGSVYVYIVICKTDTTVNIDPYGNLSKAYQIGAYEDVLNNRISTNTQNIDAFDKRIDAQEQITGSLHDMSANMYYNTTSQKFVSADTRVSIAEPVYTDRISVYPGTDENFYVVLLNKVADTGVLNTDYEYVSSEGWISTEYSNVFDTPTYVYVFARKSGNPEITPADIHTSVVSWSKLLDRKIELMIEDATDDDVPEYYRTHIVSKCDEINSKERILGANGDTFIFVTDTHWNFNTKNSPALVNYILNHTPVNWVYHGGDFIDNRQTGYETHNFVWKDVQNMITIRGNHDKNFNASVPTDIISDEAFYGIVVRPFEEKVTIDRKLYWYRDNEAQKIRYFFLDTGANWDTLSSDCLTWLKTNLLAIGAEWNAVIFMHIALTISGNENETNVTIATNAVDVRNAIAEISGQMQCNIIGIICGHIHADGWIIDPSLGYPIMSTSCDASGTTRTRYDTVNNQAEAGTVTEQLFDTYLVDIINHVITTVRIGEGGNRYLHYATTEVSTSVALTPQYLTGTLTWYMGNNDTSVASVSAGTVTAVSDGYALVVAKDTSGNREAWNIHVG